MTSAEWNDFLSTQPDTARFSTNFPKYSHHSNDYTTLSAKDWVKKYGDPKTYAPTQSERFSMPHMFQSYAPRVSLGKKAQTAQSLNATQNHSETLWSRRKTTTFISTQPKATTLTRSRAKTHQTSTSMDIFSSQTIRKSSDQRTKKSSSIRTLISKTFGSLNFHKTNKN